MYIKTNCSFYRSVILHDNRNNGISLPMDLIFKYQLCLNIDDLGLVVYRLAIKSEGLKFNPCLGQTFY